MIRHHGGDGGDATEEERVSIFGADVELDEAPEEHEEIRNCRKDVGQSVLPAPHEGLPLDDRGEVVRLLEVVVCVVPRAAAEVVVVRLALLWRGG